MRRPQYVIGLSAGASILCALASAATVSAATSSPGPPGPAAQAASPVIVVLNNQAASPASAESPLISQVKAAGGTHVIGYSSVASFAATVTPAEAATLAANPAVASVVPDQKVSVAPPTASQFLAAPAPASPGGSAASGVCGTPSKPLLPEDLITTHAVQAHAQGITGAGVTVAWIADGLDPNNPDFIRAGKSIFKSYVDFSGNGPSTQTGGEEAFGDASMIAAQGNQTYDLSNYVNAAYPLPKNCDIKIEGMAPGASLIGLKAGGELLANSSILQSIDYAITHGANVINESFGANVYSDNNARDTIQLFDDAAVRHGITVTVSTGDAGISGTQGSPSTDPNVISAGASTDFQSYEQTGYAGARPFSNGKWVSGNISALSSGGISQRGQVPDLVAPGEADWALCSTNTAIFTECAGYSGKPSPIVLFGGTSEASPVTAGAAALVIQAFREYHHGVSPSPALVKQFLTSTAGDLGLPAPEQGSGLLNADAAVNYGALGAGLGHEVSHGFDADGALFDANGNLENWWTKADMDHFKAEAKKLADQYSTYEPLPGLHINGEQTSVEDIADVAGLATAWDAYRLSLRGQPAPVIDGFTAEQRFFLGFAQNFRGKYREAALRRQVVTAILPPTPYRALTVRNLDAWYSAFGVKPGQKLYLAPANRVTIW